MEKTAHSYLSYHHAVKVFKGHHSISRFSIMYYSVFKVVPHPFGTLSNGRRGC